MKRLGILIVLSVLVSMAYSQAGKQVPVALASTRGLGTINALRFMPADSGVAQPLIIFLHGAGERGSDPAVLASNAGSIPYLCANNASMKFSGKSFIIFSPQLPLSFGAWDVRFIKDAYDYALAHYNVDPTRVYLNGLSLGGGGVWQMMADSIQWVAKFAAFVPVCGTEDFDNRAQVNNNLNTTSIPFWCFHSTDDPNGATFHGGSSQYYQFATGTNSTKRRFTYYNSAGHNGCWILSSDSGHITHSVDSSNAYMYPFNRSSTASLTTNPNMYEWLLTNVSNPGILLPPTVSAGLDQVINLPQDSVSLAGSVTIYNGGPILTRAWTQTAGAATTIVSPTSFSTKIRGMIAGSYTFRLTVHDSASQTSSDDVNITVNDSPHLSQMIRIKDHEDLTGGDREDFYSTTNDVKYYGLVDPKNGISAFPSTNPFQQGVWQKQYEFYNPDSTYGYGGKRGSRVKFDMTGALDKLDVTHTVHITDIYAYAIAFETIPDSAYVYNIDAMCTDAMAQRWKYTGRPDLLTPVAKLAVHTDGVAQWSHISGLSIDCRYLLIRWVYTNHGSYLTTPNFGAWTFYGHDNYDSTVLVRQPTAWTGSDAIDSTTYDQFTGSTYGQGVDSSQTKYDGNLRFYGDKRYWDTTHLSIYSGTSKVYKKDGFLDIGPLQYRIYADITHQSWWWTMSGVTNFLTDQYKSFQRAAGRDTNAIWYVDVDSLWQDPENPASYRASGEFYYQYAGLAGSNTSVPGFKFAGITAGQNWTNKVENHNEADIHGYTPQAFWAKTMNDWDGWENRVGVSGRAGVHNADPNFQLLQAGFAFDDTIRYKNMINFSSIMRTDRTWPCYLDFNIHTYLRSTDGLGYAPNLSQQVGSHANSPGQGLLRERILQLKHTVWNAAGTNRVRVKITEYGFGNWGTPAASEIQAGIGWDVGCTLSGGGRDSMQNKAKFMSESEVIMMDAGVPNYNEFFFHNSDFGANTFLLFQDYGRTTGRDIVNFKATVFFPWWYVRTFMYRNLKGYRADHSFASQRGDSTGQWHVRFRSIAHPDSTCDVVWLGSNNGSTRTSVSISTGLKTGNFSYRQYSFSDTTGTTSVLSAGPAGTLVIPTVKETMGFFFSEDSGIVPPPTYPNDKWYLPNKTVFKNL